MRLATLILALIGGDFQPFMKEIMEEQPHRGVKFHCSILSRAPMVFLQPPSISPLPMGRTRASRPDTTGCRGCRSGIAADARHVAHHRHVELMLVSTDQVERNARIADLDLAR